MKPMTEVRVLRTVPVSDDGVTLRAIVGGTDDKVPSELFDGLKAEGYVTEIDAADVKPAIPADWRDLHHMKLITLAKAFDPSVSNKAEAVAALEVAEASQG